MGGHQAGEVASNLALAVLGQYIEDNIGLISGEKLVEKAFAAANAAVHTKASSSAKFRQMGTTLTLLYREGDTAYIGHVGDSRAYLFRGGALRRLTRDHSLVATLVEEGEITEEQALTHPQRNIILKALGLEPQVEVDVFAVQIEPGDVFVIASDGLTGLVRDETITSVLSIHAEPDAWARSLADAALQAGGTDNVSVVIVRILESSTVVPVRGAKPEPDETPAPGPGEAKAAPSRRRGGHKVRNWLIVGAVIIALLGAGFAVGFYFYNKTFWVGVRAGRVTLFRGFPFWDLAVVEEKTDIDVDFLPDNLRRRVENKLLPETEASARKTLADLEREALKNSSIVPDVQGKKYSEARGMLEELGLLPQAELVSRTGIAAEVVIDQEPVPGTRVGKGSVVKVKVVMPGSPPKEV